MAKNIAKMVKPEALLPKLEKSQEIYENYVVPLVNNCHGHLAQAKIAVLLRRGKWSSKSRDTWGSAKKISPEIKALYPEAAVDFLLTINRDIWDKLDEKQRTALVDHELCHCGRGDDDKAGNPKWIIVGHDSEEFNPILRRHGVWSDGISRMLKALEQSKQGRLWNVKGEIEEEASEDEEMAALASGQ